MEQIINNLLQIEQQLRIFHWQTKSYARHKAFGDAYDALGDLIDRFVEVYMGKNGRFTLRHGGIELVNLSEASTSEFVNAAVSTLTELSEALTDKDGDLLNIKDEMLAELNKLKYLLTLQ